MVKGGKSLSSLPVPAPPPGPTDDLTEIQQLLARYAVCITRGDLDGVLGVFTPDGTYSAFGDSYGLDEFPAPQCGQPGGGGRGEAGGLPIIAAAVDRQERTGREVRP